jgi:pimeloyl-ACP methyl ester carboxylesterase
VRAALTGAGRRLDTARALLAGDAARAVRADGFRLVPTAAGAVRVRDSGGPGPVVVLACDPPTVLEHYDELYAELVPAHRVVVLEMPGFGFSRPARGFCFAPDDYAAVVEEVLDHVGAGPCTLAFGCVWTFVAVRVAARRPDLVRALVLVQAPGWADEVAWARRIDSTGAVRTPLLGQALLAVAPGPVAERWYRTALPPGRAVEPFARPARAALRSGALFCLASLTQAWFPGPHRPAGVVRQPAVLLWGAADRTHRRSTPQRDDVPGARLVVVDGAGHFPELEAPHRLREALESLA